MENLVLGISTFIICAILFYFAFRAYRNQSTRLSIIFILASALLLRVFISMDHHLHDWDEKYHALVGKNLFENPATPALYKNPVLDYDHRNWMGNHIWLEKGPVPLYLIGASVHAFGYNEFAVRFPSILVGCLAVFLTFLIGKHLFNEKTALLAAFLHAIHGLSIELIGGRVSSDHVENFFVFFTELAFFLGVYFIATQKRKTLIAVLLGMAVGMAILTKWFPAMLVIPVWLLAALISKKFSFLSLVYYGLLTLFGCAILVFPYFYFLSNTYPQEFGWVVKKFIFAYSDAVENHTAPWYYYLHKMGVIFSEVIYLPLLLGLYYITIDTKRWQFLLLTLWWLIPVTIFSLADTKRFTYIMLAAPAFFVLASYAFHALYTTALPRLKKWYLHYALMAALIILPIRYSIERTKVFQTRETKVMWKDDLLSFNALPYDPKTTVIFDVEHYIDAMFYSDYTVYSKTPDTLTLQRLHEENYTLLQYRPDLDTVLQEIKLP